ncbi:MAG: sigma-54-dependent Fis family transcriptional regulator [Desulfobacterales bacterium]|nr:sigma-54-dependent Fis family transcriptional regulator [Desulfobacterales bacterium]
MKGLLARFHRIHHHVEPPGFELPREAADEFDQVKRAFENTAESLKRTHDELEASESKYRALFETSRDAILVCDHRARPLDINAAGCLLFRFKDRDEALSLPSLDPLFPLFRSPADAGSLMKRAGEEGFVENLEVEMVDRGGRPLTAMISATRRLNENGALEGVDLRLQRTIAMEIDCRVLLARNAREALGVLAAHHVDVVLADIRMPGMDGMELLALIKERDPAVTVIIMTAFGAISKAVDAIKAGAYDFIQKPLDETRLLRLLRKGLDLNRGLREKHLRMEPDKECEKLGDMVGRSAPMAAVFKTIRVLAESDETVLILGETGSGKDLAARAIHACGRRRRADMVTVNCPALPETILESELFGHRKGAFTNAAEDRPGLFERADGGTIFLDEIGDLSLAVQTKLLRVLQDKEIKPLGADESRQVDVRIITATNQDLKARIQGGLFREDLYYRLNVATITMPPPRDIRDDIPVLANHFLKKIAMENQAPEKQLAPEVMDHLLSRPWPGNIRELENTLRGWCALTLEDVITPRCFADAAPPGEARPGPSSRPDNSYQELKERAIADFTLEYLDDLLVRTRGNISLAAEQSGMKRQSLQKIIKRYGIDTGRYRL